MSSLPRFSASCVICRNTPSRYSPSFQNEQHHGPDRGRRTSGWVPVSRTAAQHTASTSSATVGHPLIGPLGHISLDGIHWVIVGGESGPGHRQMDHEWVRPLRDSCVAAQVAFFFKQDSGQRTEMRPWLDGMVWEQYPGDLRPPRSVDQHAGKPAETPPVEAGPRGRLHRLCGHAQEHNVVIIERVVDQKACAFSRRPNQVRPYPRIRGTASLVRIAGENPASTE